MATPASLMTSLAYCDRVIVHGLPSPHKNIQPGRIISVKGPDITVQLRCPPRILLVGSRVRHPVGKLGVVVSQPEIPDDHDLVHIGVEFDDNKDETVLVEPHHLELISPDGAASEITPVLDLEVEYYSQSRWSEVVVCQRWQVLRGDCQRSRAVALQIQLLQGHKGLRVARLALDAILPGSSADMPSPLLLLIASFVETGLVFPHQFSGYVGAVRSEFYWYDKSAKARPFAGPMDQMREEDKKDVSSSAQQEKAASESTPITAEAVAITSSSQSSQSSSSSSPWSREPLDAQPRIDCGVAVVGVGEAAFCGGVGTHPRDAYCSSVGRGFYRSAVLYDSLFDHWRNLPPMKCARHGAAAAAVGRLLFVLGGHYVDAARPVMISVEEAEERLANHERVVMVGSQPAIIHRRELEVQDFCEVLDLDDLDQGWKSLPLEAYAKLRSGTQQELTNGTAFFPAAAVGSKVVCRLEVPLSVDQSLYANSPVNVPVALVYDTANPGGGWGEIWATSQQGSGASGCAHRNSFVLTSGRPSDRKGNYASAFVFTEEEEEDKEERKPPPPSGATRAPPSPPSKSITGEWRSLPPLDVARGGGGLVSLHGRLFCFGGCDEANRAFSASASELVGLPPRFLTNNGATQEDEAVTSSRTSAAARCSSDNDGNDDDDDDDDDDWWAASEATAAADAAEEEALGNAMWQSLPWLNMPRAIHAHSMLALPRLDWSTTQ